MAEYRYSRQSFLGKDSQKIIKSCTIGIIGLGGGGSHIVQQLAHIGFQNYVLYDGDVVQETNLNRLIGARTEDIDKPKIEIAKRVIRSLLSKAKIGAYQKRWQENPIPLRSCDIIFGCVDTFSERRELEACSRRFLIPYIDIGIDVKQEKPEPPVISGQVILSMPGYPCLSCVGFLSDDKLAHEASKYGDAGDIPQVVWANGVVASYAVGIAVDIITDWTKAGPRLVYLSYDGNKSIVTPHVRLDYLSINDNCKHYPADEVGDPILKKL
ncbi:MAG: ThiF family adenylyltransferase [Syntrophales bacterium]